jgi:hypothetical protein
MSWGVPSFSDIVAKKDETIEVKIVKSWTPEKGEAVEVRYRGREKYLPGRVVDIQPDSTYDINYDDGGKEVGVKMALIKKARLKFNYKVYTARTKPSVLDFDNFVMGRVMVDFEPVKAFQLSLKRGALITVVTRSPELNGWSKAIDESGLT